MKGSCNDQEINSEPKRYSVFNKLCETPNIVFVIIKL